MSAEAKRAWPDSFSRALDLLAPRLAADERALGVTFPYVTDRRGAWQTMLATESAGYGPAGWSHGNWFSGFWIGLLLIAHLRTGDQRFRALALERLRLVAPRAEDPATHDIGFIFSASAVPAAHITGEAWCRALALRAARRLRARIVNTDTGAYIAAWGNADDPRGRRSSAIDTMANLDLLLWASGTTGDGSFRLAAEAHADMTCRAFIRPDRSTFHAVEYDLPSGAPARRFTFQGHSDTSCWARGQAWAMRGFTAIAACTRSEDHLRLAGELADYFLRRLPPDLIPYWDFDDPAIPAAPRDSSAAAIAAGALLGLARIEPAPDRAARRQEQAIALLAALCRDCLADAPLPRGLLRHGCYSLPHGEGIDGATLFGDFYFAEALAMALMPHRFSLWPALPGADAS